NNTVSRSCPSEDGCAPGHAVVDSARLDIMNSRPARTTPRASISGTSCIPLGTVEDSTFTRREAYGPGDGLTKISTPDRLGVRLRRGTQFLPHRKEAPWQINRRAARG